MYDQQPSQSPQDPPQSQGGSLLNDVFFLLFMAPSSDKKPAKQGPVRRHNPAALDAPAKHEEGSRSLAGANDAMREEWSVELVDAGSADGVFTKTYEGVKNFFGKKILGKDSEPTKYSVHDFGQMRAPGLSSGKYSSRSGGDFVGTSSHADVGHASRIGSTGKSSEALAESGSLPVVAESSEIDAMGRITLNLLEFV